MDWLSHILRFVEAYNGAITAIATVFVAAFTAVLYRATNKQAALTRQAIELSRQEYISTHRPRLSIRHVIPTIQNGEPISIRCTVTNVGETNARLEGQNIAITVCPFRPLSVGQEQPPAEPLRSTIWLLMSDLIGGQSEIFLTQRGTEFKCSDEWKLDSVPGGAMFIEGEFLYTDENNVARRIGFSRRYNPISRRFDNLNESEDEYQD